MVDLSVLGSFLVFGASFLLNLLVLLYRWERTPSVRRAVDRLRERLTGERDWSWLGLRHLLFPLAVVTAVNIAWNVALVRCSDDSLAILASGQAALHGGNPFLVNYCASTSPDQIPYGTAEVLLNALGALAGHVVGVWLVWQMLALAVVPLVWRVAGADRRYVATLAATSILYLPNIATNIGVENAVVPVAVLLMLAALTVPGRRGLLVRAVAAFLSTARFPAVFPELGAGASQGRRWAHLLLVAAVFGGAALASYALWGPDAIRIVYLNQFSRVPGESLNVFAYLLRSGWFHPSLVSAALQGGGLLALVLFVHLRRYSPAAAGAVPILGVMALSQYLTYHFVVWVLPVVLLGGAVNRWLFVYGTLTYLDETVASWYFGSVAGNWVPYELLGVVLSALLVYLIYRVVRDEEARLRARRTAPAVPTPGAG